MVCEYTKVAYSLPPPTPSSAPKAKAGVVTKGGAARGAVRHRHLTKDDLMKLLSSYKYQSIATMWHPANKGGFHRKPLATLFSEQLYSCRFPWES